MGAISTFFIICLFLSLKLLIVWLYNNKLKTNVSNPSQERKWVFSIISIIYKPIKYFFLKKNSKMASKFYKVKILKIFNYNSEFFGQYSKLILN